MDDGRLLGVLTGGSMSIGTVVLAAAGGPVWAVAMFGGLAALGLISAITGD